MAPRAAKSKQSKASLVTESGEPDDAVMEGAAATAVRRSTRTKRQIISIQQEEPPSPPAAKPSSKRAKKASSVQESAPVADVAPKQAPTKPENRRTKSSRAKSAAVPVADADEEPSKSNGKKAKKTGPLTKDSKDGAPAKKTKAAPKVAKAQSAKSSSRKKTTKDVVADASEEEEEASDSSAEDSPESNGKKSKKSGPATKGKESAPGKTKAAPKAAKAQSAKSSSKKKTTRDIVADPSEEEEAPDTTEESSLPKKKTKAPKHQVLTEKDTLPKLWDEDKARMNASYTFKIATWNVAGLRALLNKDPDSLVKLCQKHNLDVLCLQETKLQEMHLDDPKLGNIRSTLLTDQYDSYYSCSTTKKGYAGTAVFVKRRQNKKNAAASKNDDDESDDGKPRGKDQKSDDSSGSEPDQTGLPVPISHLTPSAISFEMGKPEHDGEGRIIVVDFPSFSLINVYVPNSGDKLQRLQYRTEVWDKDLLAFCQAKQKEKAIVLAGDLNVAHTHLEVWNDGAKHLAKQACVTPEERASFQNQLDTGGFVDAFRKLHPTAAGHYTFWSLRAGNRVHNKGLRLDYFVCDPVLFDPATRVVVRDCYMDCDQLGSDHCPAILELEIKV